TGQQNVSASLERRRDDLSPPALEPRAGHHAVLHGEEAQEQRINDQPLSERLACSCSREIDRPGHDQGFSGAVQIPSTDKADGVQESAKEDQVTNRTVRESDHSLQHFVSPCWLNARLRVSALRYARHYIRGSSIVKQAAGVT